MAFLELKLQEAKNELAEALRKQSTKRTRLPRNNKKVFHIQPELQDDPEHPLVDRPNDVGDYE